MPQTRVQSNYLIATGSLGFGSDDMDLLFIADRPRFFLTLNHQLADPLCNRYVISQFLTSQSMDLPLIQDLNTPSRALLQLSLTVLYTFAINYYLGLEINSFEDFTSSRFLLLLVILLTSYYCPLPFRSSLLR